MENGLFSIITPCYNGKRFVKSCFDSVLAQTYKNIEFIAVDDGSTDGSYEEMQSYADTFKACGISFKLLKKENGGAASAVNLGLKSVSGEYLQLLDIDDTLTPSSIEDKLYLLCDGADAVISNGYYVNLADKQQAPKLFYSIGQDKKLENAFDDILYSRLQNWPSSYAVRCQTLFDFYPNRDIYISDYGQNLQILLPCCYKKKVMYSDKPSMNYVKHQDSFVAKHSKEDIIGLYNGFKSIRIHMISEIITDTAEAERYKREINAHYAKEFVNICSAAGDRNGVTENYKALKNAGKPDKNSRYLYYKAKYPRIVKFIKKLLKKR